MILAESSHYRITSEFETVFLEDTINHARTVIGEFYGDPEGAFIDHRERFAVVYGCGLLVYPLAASCPAILTNGIFPTEQGNLIWIVHAEQKEDTHIRITMESGESVEISPFI